MHQKKRKAYKLHSIPIGLCKNSRREKLYLVSYSIPLACMVALLFGLGMMANPSLFITDKSCAVEIKDEWEVASNDNDNSEDGISLLDSESAGITFEIGGEAKDATIEAVPGQVAYREHTITVNISDADEYVLLISGQSNITNESNNNAKLVGMTEAATGSEIPDGEWGYGWAYQNYTDKESMTYQAVPAANKEIATPKLVNNATNFVGHLNFAGKFPEEAAMGSYTGGTATLRLVVSPKSATGGAVWKKADGSDSTYYSGITSMQEIELATPEDGGFCKNNEIVQPGWTIELQDNRGSNPVTTYKIIKMLDGSCWMAENLRLKSGSKITPTDSDVKSDYTLPASFVNGSTVTWGGDNDGEYMADGAENMKQYSGSGPWKEAYGNYYSWCTATARSCRHRTGSAITSGEAAESICPKGWKLPKGDASTTGSFQGLSDKYPNSTTAGWLEGQEISYNGSTKTGYNGIKLGYDSINAFFPVAGDVSGVGLRAASSDGYYWSRTSGSSGTLAYGLLFYSSNVNPRYETGRHNGHSVRCVADTVPVGYWAKDEAGTETFDTGLREMQEVTKENFSDKYCSTSANSLVPVGSVIKLQDSRDGNVYKIVKLKDGNCWMQENLRLAAKEGNGLTLLPSDSDVSESWTLPKTQDSSATTWTDDNTEVMSRENDRANGNYYTWCAATANTCQADGVPIGNYNVATGSICPKGWHLPSGGGNAQNGTGEFKVLNGLNYELVQQSPYLFPTAGAVSTGGRDSTGSYWSRTAMGTSYAYMLRFYYTSNEIQPGTYNFARSMGNTVRCVAN